MYFPTFDSHLFINKMDKVTWNQQKDEFFLDLLLELKSKRITENGMKKQKWNSVSSKMTQKFNSAFGVEKLSSHYQVVH